MELSLKADSENDAPLSHLASTKLNLCAVLSILNRHAEARTLAAEAVKHLFDTINALSDKDVNRSLLCNTITVALFNLGAEHEHMSDLQEALAAFRKALDFARRGGFQPLEEQAA